MFMCDVLDVQFGSRVRFVILNSNSDRFLRALKDKRKRDELMIRI